MTKYMVRVSKDLQIECEDSKQIVENVARDKASKNLGDFSVEIIRVIESDTQQTLL